MIEIGKREEWGRGRDSSGRTPGKTGRTTVEWNRELDTGRDGKWKRRGMNGRKDKRGR